MSQTQPPTPPVTPPPQQNVQPTEVVLVTGKKANRAYRQALALRRQNATLSESPNPHPQSIPETPNDDEKENAER